MQRFAIIAAAALAAGSIGYAGCDRDETASNKPANTSGDTVGDKVDRVMDRTGDAVGNVTDKTVEAGKEAGATIASATEGAVRGVREGMRDADKGTAGAADAKAVGGLLASVTQAALTENGLNDVTERLVDADRNRIGSAIGGDFPDHAALVQQFRADWKTKYRQDFNIQGDNVALPASMFTVSQGEIPEGAAGAEVDVDRNADGGATVDVDAKSGVDAPDTNAADTNRNDPGRNIASVSVTASHGLPELTVPLIHEAPANWRIDVPDSIDAAKLKQNVIDHLQAAHAMKDQWPEDVNDAYAAVSHHVLMALLDKPGQK